MMTTRVPHNGTNGILGTNETNGTLVTNGINGTNGVEDGLEEQFLPPPLRLDDKIRAQKVSFRSFQKSNFYFRRPHVIIKTRAFARAR